MTTPELLPCPFCGGKADFSLGKTGEGEDWHYLECAECEAMGPRVQYAAHNIAIKDALSSAWNTRADLSAVQPMQVHPDPRDEVIARLVDVMHTISGDIQINADGEEELSDAARIARAALAAAKAAQS